MDVVARPQPDPLAQRLAAELFGALVDLRRAATTQELAGVVRRHHNTVRTQLERLATAGLVERRTVRQARGRPRHEWAIARDASPGGRPPEGYTDLGRWLARAVGRGGGVDVIEETGREIGRELAPAGPHRSAIDAMRDVLVALGFAPRLEQPEPGHARYVLGNCPYREAVRENQPAVCALHRGISQGLLDRLDPETRLAAFVPRDPDAAGCLIHLELAEMPPVAP